MSPPDLWKHLPFVSFDTETTGLDDTAFVVEFAAVRYESGREVSAYQTLICPERVDWESPAVKEAMRTNDIGRDELLEAPSFEAAFDDICNSLAAPLLVAHNTPFDLRMLRLERKRLEAKLGVDLSNRVSKPRAVFDTLVLDVGLCEGFFSRKLENVAKRWRVPPAPSHQALEDARTAGDIFLSMRPRLHQDLPTVLNWQKMLQARWEKICAEKKASGEVKTP